LAQKQYSGSTLHLDEAHAISKGAKALVGVIDTEVDRAHPEISGAISDSFDALGADPELDDANNTSTYENSLVMSLTLAPQPDAHGTAIVGIIAGHTQLTGVAPEAHVLAVRAFGLRGDTVGARGTTYDICAGVEWAILNGARIINMSFAGPSDPKLSEEIASGSQLGVVFIASVGNEGKMAEPL
jgi:subtilisin family serine protease